MTASFHVISDHYHYHYIVRQYSPLELSQRTQAIPTLPEHCSVRPTNSYTDGLENIHRLNFSFRICPSSDVRANKTAEVYASRTVCDLTLLQTCLQSSMILFGSLHCFCQQQSKINIKFWNLLSIKFNSPKFKIINTTCRKNAGSRLEKMNAFFPIHLLFPAALDPGLYSRGWIDPVPDPLFLRKSGSAGNRAWDLWIYNQEFWSIGHRGGLLSST
jgi:hypothetical protein